MHPCAQQLPLMYCKAVAIAPIQHTSTRLLMLHVELCSTAVHVCQHTPATHLSLGSLANAAVISSCSTGGRPGGTASCQGPRTASRMASCVRPAHALLPAHTSNHNSAQHSLDYQCHHMACAAHWAHNAR